MSDTNIEIVITPEGEISVDAHSVKGKCSEVMDGIRKALGPKMNMGPVHETNNSFIKDEKVVANANQG